jgi:hypothetical protein
MKDNGTMSENGAFALYPQNFRTIVDRQIVSETVTQWLEDLFPRSKESAGYHSNG